MAIKSIKELKRDKIEIDLTGPQGNAFYLLGMASNIGKKLGKSEKEIQEIQEDMRCGDYDHLVWVFNKHYGFYVDLYR